MLAHYFAGPAFVLAIVDFASDDSSYIAGQVLHPTGGKIING